MSDFSLSDVCRVHVVGLSREQRPRKTKIGTEVAHVTCDSDTTFKVKRLKVKVTGAGHIVAASRTACFIQLYRAAFGFLGRSQTARLPGHRFRTPFGSAVPRLIEE